MKILINDYEAAWSQYKTIFEQFGYEKNELIFQNSFQNTKEFIVQTLENNKQHVDLIITNDSEEHNNSDPLKSRELLYFKNSLTGSYSNGNLRICSIPILLYSHHDTKLLHLNGFDAIVKKNTEGNHRYFLSTCETLIKKNRSALLEDLDAMGIKIQYLQKFSSSRYFKYYRQTVISKSEIYFSS